MYIYLGVISNYVDYVESRLDDLTLFFKMPVLDFLGDVFRNHVTQFSLVETGSWASLIINFLFFCTVFNLQLLDLPGIIEGAKDGKGRGRQVMCGYLSDMIILRRPYMINFYAFIYYGHFCL